jgi:hypothetical protein
MNRRWELDALRGLMLLLMTVTHLPTAFSRLIGQPFGFVSAAEGFVFLSAFMAGSIYTRRAMQRGIPAMRHAFLGRALRLYACHVAMLLFLFTIIAPIGVSTNQQSITNLLSFYLRDPFTAVWSGLALIYIPPLADILPLYVLFMLASPWILTYALVRGWTSIMVVSVFLWFLAQFELGRLVYTATVAITGLKVPFREMGAFEIFAWQFLWIFGLWVGWRDATAEDVSLKFPRWLLGIASAIALAAFFWRHAVGQIPFGTHETLNMLFDKWHLAPFRMINFFALLVVTVHFGPRLRDKLRCRFLENLGAASLPVFCAHLVIVLLALAAFGDYQPLSLWVDAAIVGGSVAVLYTVARIAHRVQPIGAVAIPDARAPINVRAVR